MRKINFDVVEKFEMRKCREIHFKYRNIVAIPLLIAAFLKKIQFLTKLSFQKTSVYIREPCVRMINDYVRIWFETSYSMKKIAHSIYFPLPPPPNRTKVFRLDTFGLVSKHARHILNEPWTRVMINYRCTSVLRSLHHSLNGNN